MQWETVQGEVTGITDENTCGGWTVSLQQCRGETEGTPLVPALRCIPVQFSSVAWSCPTLPDPMDRSTPGLPVHHQLIFIESVMPSNHFILCCPLLLLPSLFPSMRVFSSESVLHIRWPKKGSFSFSISPSSEHPGLISFRKDWQNVVYWRREMHPNSTSNPSFCLH